MKFTKPHFIASVSDEAQEQKKLLISKYGDFDANNSDIFILLKNVSVRKFCRVSN